ncbi:PREDICTED: probably inactive leucine-rich repeat receptor-like protein kinase At3g28040 [Nelumbo nucifera]|uniref:Probably inactive leucine-rich repeat receptor-like protein kinase At3g28040 n=2 Tax=Nelumbo nucifera TaxID=4432 RepID=A0A1U8ASN2_NELNU|nr:PREDICTED: probably inactive leucine-rich repeat receptor-like protein kinase At3g28040 [Nelumbo nucifera]DAD41359.1 TPA_asm: hypothetical protein HUJ06_015682 [Nelumbo nucifera]
MPPLAMSNFLLPLLCFSALFLLPVQALTLPSDTSALKAFKEAIKPTTIPPWSCLASWNFSCDPCSLPRRSDFICGITCNSDSTRVTALVLDPAGYSGTLSPLLSKLTQLTHLDLSDNSFYGPIPSSLSSLTNLQTLSLRSNSFSGSFSPSLTQLPSLSFLDISHNALTGSLPQTMSSLSSLRTIDLSFNKLTGSLPKLPSNLLELAIKANSLTGPLLQSSFQGSPRLEVVELSGNMFNGVIKGWFFQLPSLQQVDLSNNSFTGLEISKPSDANGNLVAVDLGFNSIEGYLPVNFASYPLLSSLSLRYNRFRGPIPMEYSNNLSLRRLFLDGNFLNGKAPLGFFSDGSSVSGSFGDNCLQSCPNSSRLCLPSQKPNSICRHAYDGKPRSGSSQP